MENITIDFYWYHGDAHYKNVINKSLGNPGKTTQCYIKDPMNVTHPTIIISNTAFKDSENKYRFNYAHISNFERYYFVRPEKTFKPGGMIEVQLDIDVLMSYRDVLMSQPFLIERTNYSKWKSPYLNDSAIMSKNRKSIQYKTFGDPVIVPTNTVVLHTSGIYSGD